jgi:hypothetical protein
MARDLQAEKEAFEERMAICLADGLPEPEALRIADKQLWDMIRESEKDTNPGTSATIPS